MTHHTQREAIRPLIGLAVLLTATGCATTSDLDKLEHNLAQKLDAQTRAIRSEVATIRDQVKGIKAEVEGLRAQVGTFQMDMRAALEDEKKTDAMRDQILKDLTLVTTGTKKAVEGSQAAAQEELKKLEAVTGDATRQLQALQQVISTVSARMEQLPGQVGALSGELRALTDTMWGTYTLEEAALKDRLKALDEMKRRLKPLEARQPGEAGPAR
jgi:chromosome segregation ATPase